MQVFVQVTGQEDNIGDIVLRRELLATAGQFGELNLYTGGHSEAYLDGLRCRPSRVFSTHESWLAAMLDAAVQGPTLLFAKPGELQNDWRFIRYLLKVRLHVAKLQRSGGNAFLLGVGMRHSLPLLKRAALKVALSDYKLIGWRDVRSARELGIGEVMPDWAFGEDVSATDAPRNLLVVSMRGDRPLPSTRWFKLLRSYAKAQNLTIAVVTQVGRDQARSAELANRLGVQPELWIDGEYEAQETALRATYQAARLVVSDRMHVLIVAAVEGAVPLCLTDQPEEKIERHFQAIGYAGVSHTLETLTDRDAADLLERQPGRSAELSGKLAAARQAIGEIEERIRRLIR